jgi:dienelactone hydrolase
MRAFVFLFSLLVLAAPAAAQAPGVTVPVARTEVAKGAGTIVGLKDRPADARDLDGARGDWNGRLPGFGGVLLYSRGELVYEDHIWDAYGADSGQDAQRLAVQDPLNEAAPETYRVDPALQYVPGEFGVPTGPLAYATNYGDLPLQEAADLSELRLGTDADGALWVLGRTTTMKETDHTALLLLLDTVPGETSRPVPYGSGLTTTRGDVAVLLTGDSGSWTDLATGEVHAFGGVATNPEGYENTMEARVPASALGSARKFGVAAAAGLLEGDALTIANVAFRTKEPVRDYFDKQQALALERGTIDPFFATADLDRMAGGENERFVPGPGYHDRNFLSSETISVEGGRNGVLQHYGVYVPSGYDRSRPTPAQYWMHFRGGRAHIAAAVVPGIHHDMGETAHSLVITPEGRGKDKWYMGKSHVDFDEVWRDSHRRFAIDRNRTYVAGHSMGGWASWLLPVLYPDRFAATYPASGLPAFEESTTGLLENLREVPAVIFHGTEDELVPVTGAIDQANRLQELGYRYRLYLFPGQEHYGPPIVDQWSDGVRYEHAFVRNPNPARVTFSRSMPMEKAVETYAADGVALDFSFDRAYWMSGLEPVDGAAGIARFDGSSQAIAERPHTTFPEVGGPALPDQAGPYAMRGQAWVTASQAPAGETRNAFTASLTGARAVTLSLRRMRLDVERPLTGEITTEAPLRLTLRGAKGAEATLDGSPVQMDGATVTVPAGTHTLVLR